MKARFAMGCMLAALGCSRVGEVPPWWVETVPDALMCPPRESPERQSSSRAEAERDSEKTTREPIGQAGAKQEGLLPAEEIQATIRAHYDLLRVCYEQALARRRTARGKVTMRFVINPDGSVSAACVDEASLSDGDAVRCMLEVFKKITFDPSPGETTVVYPIRYDPEPSQ